MTTFTLDDPRHGTTAGAVAHHHHGVPMCEPCRVARRRYQSRLELDRLHGIARSSDPARAIAHLAALRAAGLSINEVARRAGGQVAASSLYNIVGEHRRGVLGRILTSTEAAILSVPLPIEMGRCGYLPRLGVIRRIEALTAIGWSRSHVAARLGMSRSGLANLMSDRHGDLVQAVTWHRIDAVYTDLHMTPGPDAHARTRALRDRCAPPLAWDNIDDPAEDPHARDLEEQRWVRWWTSRGYADIDEAVVLQLVAGQRVPASKAEREEAMRRWRANGGSARALAHTQGWHDGRYTGRDATSHDRAQDAGAAA